MTKPSNNSLPLPLSVATPEASGSWAVHLAAAESTKSGLQSPCLSHPEPPDGGARAAQGHVLDVSFRPNAEQLARAENRGESTGYLGPPEQGWITGELIEDTRRVWSKRYGRLITPEEAMGILVNVKKVAEAFLKAMRRPTE